MCGGYLHKKSLGCLWGISRNHERIPGDKVCANPYTDLTHTRYFTHNPQHTPPAYKQYTHCTFRTHWAYCAFSGHLCGLCPVSLLSDRQSDMRYFKFTEYIILCLHNHFCLGNVATSLINSILSLTKELHLISNEKHLIRLFIYLFKIIMAWGNHQ